MDIGSVITAGILSGALVFGHTASETGFPKEIDEVTYNLVPAYVQEINWSDDSSKLNKMYTKSYIDNNGVLHLYTSKDYADNTYTLYGMEKADTTSDTDNNGIENGDIYYDKQMYKVYTTDNTDSYDNNTGSSAGYKSSSNGILYSDMQEMIQAYKNAGYNHTVVSFPVTKAEPYYNSKSKFLNQVPFDEITHMAVYGFASPDGSVPEMQEALAEKRRDNILSYIEQEDITVENTGYFVCDKSVTRNLCWKVDIFYK